MKPALSSRAAASLISLTGLESTSTFVLETAAPIGLLVALLCYDLTLSIRWPKRVRRFAAALVLPVTAFITARDIEEPEIPVASPPLWKTRTVVVCAALEAALWVALFTFSLAAGSGPLDARSAVNAVIWAYVASRIWSNPPRTPPYLLMFIATCYGSSAFLDLGIDFTTGTLHVGPLLLNVFRLVVPAAFVWVAGSLSLRPTVPGDQVADSKEVPVYDRTCPEDSVTLWEWCTFSFVEPLFGIATLRTLDEGDVWSLSPYFTHRNLFNAYLRYHAKYPTHSLLRFLIVSNSLDLILDIVLELWSATAGFVPPYALQTILAALADPTPANKRTAYTWTAITFVANLSFAQVDLFQGWHTRRCYERTRGQLFSALHYKALKRREVGGTLGDDEDTPGSADLGKVVNLMQGDSYAVAQRFWEASAIFASPVRLVIAIIFLYQILGWSSLLGVAIVLFAHLLNYPLARYNIHITRYSWKAKDKRMSVVNELLQNIRFLKFYGWENLWAQRADNARNVELKWRVRQNVIDTAMGFIWTWMPSATALSVFLCFTLISGEKLTVSKAFTSLALFSYLQDPMTALPGQIMAFIYAYVSMQRIEAFLAEEEVPDWASSLKRTGEDASTSDLEFVDASFEWHVAQKTASPARFRLGPLSVKFLSGKLTLVSGGTSSGKSALLAALLGELKCVTGEVRFQKAGHRVAYCAQNPWLEHATIRNNILFGAARGFEESRYYAVIHACALEKDLDVLDAGDLTEIGEKGITLSGGQRARIALARALYSDASCILLDDPLAAVDMHTAQHLVDYALTGPLAHDRTIILVTHHIRLCLPLASYVVELAGGRVIRQGTPVELDHLGMLAQVISEEDAPLTAVEEVPGQTIENEVDGVENAKPSKRPVLSDGKLVEKEARAEGRISYRTYLTYFRAAGWFPAILTILLMLIIRLITFGNQLFVAKWGEAYERPATAASVLAVQILSPLDRLPPPEEDVKPWLVVYTCISLAGAFTVLTYIALGFYASLQASRALFSQMLARLTKAPARFFDVTPIGRILNRFTSDINIVDGALQASARAALAGVLNFVISFLAIVWIVPSFAPLALFIAWLYIRLAPAYIRASRDLRRLESISLSPAFAGFDELLRGITHIRAFAMEQRFQDAFYKKVDRFQAYDHVYWLVSGWLRWRYDCLGSVIVFMTTLFALQSGVSNGYAALVIVQAGIFADASRQLVKVAAQLELDFNSVERIVEYLDVPQEKASIILDQRPPAYWPSSNGGIVVENLVIRYAPGLPDVLRSISFTLNPSEKVGVVGRTGSGKSTLALSLLRIVEASEGRILIDGIDISAIGLEDLRTRITIVSQDVSLFSGTLRSNLDPFNEHSDKECWDVLEHCHLKGLLNRGVEEGDVTAITLDMPVGQNSLSAGEKQLLALARAVLRRTNIVIMDEATAQVDQSLDDKIQRTIRTELSHALVLTIAHRLKTVISDYDRIMVLGDGKIVEFDNPHALLSKPGGAFREMCRKSADWPLLQAMAETSRKK